MTTATDVKYDPSQDGWQFESDDLLIVAQSPHLDHGSIKTALKASRGETTLWTETVNLTSPKSRQSFIKALAEKGATVLEGQLVGLETVCRQNLSRITKGAPPVTKQTDPESPQLPRIMVSGRHMKDITTEAIAALKEVNGDNPWVFQRGDSLVRLRTDKGLIAEALNIASLRGILDRCADFVKLVGKDGAEVPARPGSDVLTDILSLPDMGFPGLQGFYSAPVFLPSGELLSQDGYHSESSLYLSLNGLTDVAGTMSLDAAKFLLLNDLLGDFPFADLGSKAHALALLLQGFVRLMIDGPTPLYLIDAPARGTGKGLFSDIVSVVTLGKSADVMVLPKDEDELEKRITAILVEGHSLILLDNVTSLRSATLSAVLTTTDWQGRWLGKSQMVHAPNTATWVATGNNVGLSDELVRRTVGIRLDAAVERPETRTDFKHPRLVEWAFTNRPKLVNACISIIQAWIDAGMPQYKPKKTLGRFESWVGVMGGILKNAGVEGFLDNRETLYAIADAETTEWTALCGEWWKVYKGTAITGKDLLQIAKDTYLVLQIWAGKSEISGQQRFGHALVNKRDRVFGQYRIRHAGNSSGSGSHQYILENSKNEGTDKTPETPETKSTEPESGSQPPLVSDDQTPETPPETTQNQVPVLGTETVVSVVSVVLKEPLKNSDDSDQDDLEV